MDYFPVDVILLGMAAAFLALRLRSVLGRRTGFEQPPRPMASAKPAARPAFGFRAKPEGAVIEGKAEPAETPPARVLPAAESEAGRGLAEIKRLDPGFDAARFLSGAEKAFFSIVNAYAAGQRDVLRPLLTEEAYAGFEAAIAARETAGEAVRCELRRVHDLMVRAAGVAERPEGGVARITLRFVSDQINVTTGRDGKVVAGVDAVTEILDLWTFERPLAAAAGAWKLAAAELG